ncbi:hypothetical protein SASPL_148491 [Salvia splendens]|uniref:Uncharacterized protein n=1 Tax=Salvia splendens TaxID=180675 RepID=A0A8X8Z3R4_SALSN|nr:hypothetical protein SASPL_148491 [Salvia splendens]
MQVKIVSKRLVKPRTPTPQSLRTYHISFMDELNPTMNVVGIFYYNSPAAANLDYLHQSLSEILPSFYPFAGRYMKQDRAVDCSDQGALLIEAEVDLQMLETMKLDVVEELNDILPYEIGAADDETDPVLLVQFNKFKCGGLAISICISHRVVDACSLGTFVSAWMNAARGENREEICPVYDGPVFFPGKNFPAPEFGTIRGRENGLYNIICKRFLFDKNTISGLKERVFNPTEQSRPPSRVGVVSELIVKAIDQLSTEETKKMGLEDYVRVLGSDARKTVHDCAELISEEGHREWIEASHEASDISLREDVNVVWVLEQVWILRGRFRVGEAGVGECG